VPRIDAVTEVDIAATAGEFLTPEDAAIVVVGDAEKCQKELESLNLPVSGFEPEF
jgi:predicted Zn-dependent peptidase